MIKFLPHDVPSCKQIIVTIFAHVRTNNVYYARIPCDYRFTRIETFPTIVTLFVFPKTQVWKFGYSTLCKSQPEFSLLIVLPSSNSATQKISPFKVIRILEIFCRFIFSRLSTQSFGRKMTQLPPFVRVSLRVIGKFNSPYFRLFGYLISPCSTSLGRVMFS